MIGMRKVALVGLLAASLLLAGCMDAGGSNVDPADRKAVEDAGLGDLANSTIEDTSSGMATPGNRSDDHLPHVHDYWADRDRILVADDAVDLEILTGMTFYHTFARRDPTVGATWWELPQGKTVYQGTGVLELTFNWDDPAIMGVGMAYRHAGSPEFTEFQPLSKGQVLAIEVTPEMSDLPHAGLSRWAFMFKGFGSPPVAYGKVSLKAELVRVHDLHAYPAHANFYETTDTLVLMDAEAKSTNRAFTTQIVNFATAGEDAEEGFTLPEGSIVPPGTEVITVKMTLKGDAKGADWVDFSYRDGGGNWNRAEPLENAEDPNTYEFLLFVEPGTSDSPYATLSSWRFYVYADVRPSGTDLSFCGGCADQTVEFHALITGFADNPYSEDEEEPER